MQTNYEYINYYWYENIVSKSILQILDSLSLWEILCGRMEPCRDTISKNS
jgi:hypothetical protein